MDRREWSLQDAKNSFSAVVDAASKGTPQTVTKRGKPAVVVLSVADYEKLKQTAAHHRPWRRAMCGISRRLVLRSRTRSKAEDQAESGLRRPAACQSPGAGAGGDSGISDRIKLTTTRIDTPPMTPTSRSRPGLIDSGGPCPWTRLIK